MKEIALSIAGASGAHRFHGILNGNAADTCDQVLLDRPDWVVAPSIGAIIPGWLLIIPKRQALNFRDWSSANSTDAGELIAELLAHLGLSLDEIIWFEHGPGAAQSVVGCGLDHAHIHVLVRPPFPFKCFEAAAKSNGLLEWQSSENGVDYSLLDQSGSYFIAGGGSRVIAAANVEVAGSQFLRRVVASLIGDEDGWDYRRIPHLANVEATAFSFRDLAARRLNG